MSLNNLFYTKRLSDLIESNTYRKNNFDFIRFAAALIVILSHSFPISYGKDVSDPLKNITGSVSFGLLGVYIFFIISGFLILISYKQSKRTKHLKSLLPIAIGYVVHISWDILIVGASAHAGCMDTIEVVKWA